MERCRKCSSELVVGVNWSDSCVKRDDRICKGCQKDYRQHNTEKIKQNWKEYYENNKEKLREDKKEYREHNKEKIKEINKEYYENNKEKLREDKKEYNNKPETKKKNNERRKSRKQADPNYKIAENLRSRMNAAIRNGQKAGSAVDDLGISVEAFRMYLAEQFEEGMTWENHGTLWHVDHIKPLCQFDLTDRDQFLEAANWMNQRPLWAIDNLKKISEDKKKSFRNKLT